MPLPAALAPATERTMSARARQDLALVAAVLAGQTRTYEELLQYYRTAVYHLLSGGHPAATQHLVLAAIAELDEFTKPDYDSTFTKRAQQMSFVTFQMGA